MYRLYVKTLVTVTLLIFISSGATVAQTGMPDRVYAIDWKPDMTQFAVAKGNGTTQIISVSTGQILRTIQTEVDGVTASVAWHPSLDLIATSGSDGIVYVWDVNTGNSVKDFEVGFTTSSVDWSPSGNQIMGVAIDGELTVWNYGTELVEFTYNADFTSLKAKWSPNGDYVAIESGTVIEIISVDTGTRTRQLAPSLNIMDFDWSPTQDHLVTLDTNKRLIIWDSTTSNQITSYGGSSSIFPEILYTVDYSADGGQIITGDAAGTLIFWDPTTWTQTNVMSINGVITEVAISENNVVVVGDQDGDFDIPNQPPVADAGSGYLCHVVAATDTCQFQLDASGSSDSDGTLVAYQWAYRPVNTSDWLPIDPNVTEYTSPTVFFSPTPGDYEVRVRVRDDDFATAEAVTSMEVNRRPTIVIDPTLPICTVDSAGQSCTITVDAGQSSDPDGTVERYLWYVRLPDGSQPLLGETTAADPTWDYTLQSGQHNLVLRIIDNDGGTRGKLFQAIANIRPVADAGADQDVYVWPGNPRTGAFPYSAPITLDGTDSSDPDGIIFTYEWYRIQNNLSTGTETRSSIGNGATLQYNAGVIGCVQTIELVVTDNHAATHADRMSVDVSGDGAWTPPGGCGGVFTR